MAAPLRGLEGVGEGRKPAERLLLSSRGELALGLTSTGGGDVRTGGIVDTWKAAREFTIDYIWGARRCHGQMRFSREEQEL